LGKEILKCFAIIFIALIIECWKKRKERKKERKKENKESKSEWN